MSQTYIHVQMYNWQQIILDPNVLWIVKNEPGDSSCDIYMKALDCNFHVEVTSYHISWVSYRTAEDHAKYHAKDLKQKKACINDFQMIKIDKKASKLLACLTQVNQIIITNNTGIFICAT